MRDRVHQVQEGGVLVQDVVERGSLQTEVLAEETRGGENQTREDLRRTSKPGSGTRDKRRAASEIFMKGDDGAFIFSLQGHKSSHLRGIEPHLLVLT